MHGGPVAIGFLFTILGNSKSGCYIQAAILYYKALCELSFTQQQKQQAKVMCSGPACLLYMAKLPVAYIS